MHERECRAVGGAVGVALVKWEVGRNSGCGSSYNLLHESGLVRLV